MQLKYLTKKDAKHVAVWSRIGVFLIQLLANAVPDYQGDAFQPDVRPAVGWIDVVIRTALDGFHKWDAQYFTYIAEHGYKEESTFAFFPMLPMSCHGIAAVLTSMTNILSFHTCCLLAAFCLNTFLFIEAAAAIYDLTLLIYKDKNFVFLASICFSFNPSSIFFSSCYSETMFAFFLFKGLVAAEKRKMFQSSLWFVFASFTRSNGTVNAGFIVYYSLKHFLNMKHTGFHMVVSFLKTFLHCVMVCIPFCLFNYYGYVKFCNGVIEENLLNNNSLEIPAWCNKPIPSIYNHIQQHHWELGLFAYYKWNKIPNFILALPVVIITVKGVYEYLEKRKGEILYLGLPFRNLKIPVIRAKSAFFTSQSIFCYICHLVFLVTFSLCFMHVEVTTRMVMSGSPLPYWFAASYLYSFIDEINVTWDSWAKLSKHAKYLVGYFCSYFVTGIVLHVNFLPWT
ncbi:GPI alpha-1,6-mannosyltransferase 2-like [Ciona intestinalis]